MKEEIYEIDQYSGDELDDITNHKNKYEVLPHLEFFKL